MSDDYANDLVHRGPSATLDPSTTTQLPITMPLLLPLPAGTVPLPPLKPPPMLRKAFLFHLLLASAAGDRAKTTASVNPITFKIFILKDPNLLEFDLLCLLLYLQIPSVNIST